MRYTNTGRLPKMRQYKLTNIQIAKWFSYSSSSSFNSSKAKSQMLLGIERIITHIEEQIKKQTIKWRINRNNH